MPTDAAVLAGLAAGTFALACPPDTTAESIRDYIAANLSEECFVGYLADPARDIRLTLADGLPAGYTMLLFGEPNDTDAAAAITLHPTVELSKVYLLGEYHGVGIAAPLMAETLDVARSRGAVGVWLGVNQHNARAIRFYEKSGFVLVGAKTCMVGPDLQHDHVMERAL